MKAAELAQQFKEMGGSHAFGIPGGGPSLEWVDEFVRLGGKFVTTGHEATAGFMAGAFGRLGGCAAAVSIKGPGFANLSPALLSCRYEGYPLLAFCEAYARGGDGGRRHKWLEQRQASPWLRHPVLNEGRELVGNAWAAARQESPSPVLLELSATPCAKEACRSATKIGGGVDLAEVRRAQRPALLVGSVALRQPWVMNLATLKLPVFTTAAAKGVIDERLAHAAGIFTGDGKPTTVEKRLMPEIDLLVCIGVRAGELLVSSLLDIHSLILESDDVNDAELFPDSPLSVGASKVGPEQLQELLACLQTKCWGADEIATARKAQEHCLLQQEPGWTLLFDATLTCLPDATHVLDTGNFTVLAEHFLTATTPHSVIGTPNGRFMGAGVGHALGAALARPDKPVVLWIGDGGIRSYFSELALAAELNLPLLVLCIQDGYFGSILGRARSAGMDESVLMMHPRDWQLAGMARAEFDGLQSLAAWLPDWQKQPRFTLASVRIEPHSYIQTTAQFR